MDINKAKRTLEHANLGLFRSRDTAQTLNYIINDLICVNDDMNLEEIKAQLQLLTPAIKNLANDISCAISDVNTVNEMLD